MVAISQNNPSKALPRIFT